MTNWIERKKVQGHEAHESARGYSGLLFSSVVAAAAAGFSLAAHSERGSRPGTEIVNVCTPQAGDEERDGEALYLEVQTPDQPGAIRLNTNCTVLDVEAAKQYARANEDSSSAPAERLYFESLARLDNVEDIIARRHTCEIHPEVCRD